MTVFPEIENATFLRKEFRLALLQAGKSPDYHVYDLTDEFLLSRGKSKPVKLLIKVKTFYDTLEPEEQKFFVYEYLEPERHYRFWYMLDYRDKEWASFHAYMERKVKEAFPCATR